MFPFKWLLLAYRMVEPFFDAVGEGIIHTQMSSQSFKDLRDHALSLPKFGTASATEEVIIPLLMSSNKFSIH